MPRRQTLRVKYSRCLKVGARLLPAGWYVWVRGSLCWEAVEQLRFHRQKDAALAMLALTLAGMTTMRKLLADPEAMCEVAFSALQW